MSGVRSDIEETILQVKISLVGVSKPPVWRRLLVPAGIGLDRFHLVIQAAMGWEDCHMHVFTSGSADYGLADPGLGHEDERAATLSRLVDGPDDHIRYTYDFGDDWEHDISVEDIVARDPERLYPTCVAGKGACPPEDCGGAWGYQDLRAVLADSDHEEHDDMLDWLALERASEFDPAGFDVDEVDAALAFLSAAAR